MKRKSRTTKLKPQLQLGSRPTPNPSDLEDFIREADEVRALTASRGWSIIERDLNEYRNQIISKLAYLDPSKLEHKEARVLFIATDKVLSLVNDYEENRVKAIEMLNKLNNPDLAVTMDIDNE